MEKIIDILATETSPELMRLLGDFCRARDIGFLVVPRNGTTAYEEIVRHKPKAVLLDVFMPGMDAISLKEKYDRCFPTSSSAFFAMGAFYNEDIEEELLHKGFAFYFLKPFDCNALLDRICQTACLPKRRDFFVDLSPDFLVRDYLRCIGVPAHIKGYRFLQEAILLVASSQSTPSLVTKTLYSEIAKKNQTIPSRVERAIRHAIEVTWDRGEIETLSYYFGQKKSSIVAKPTNFEFIAVLAERVILQQKKVQ